MLTSTVRERGPAGSGMRGSAVSIRDGAQIPKQQICKKGPASRNCKLPAFPCRPKLPSCHERQLTCRKTESNKRRRKTQTRTLQRSAVAAHPSALIGPGPRLMQAACGRLVSHVRTPGRHRISGLVAVLHPTGPTRAHPAATHAGCRAPMGGQGRPDGRRAFAAATWLGIHAPPRGGRGGCGRTWTWACIVVGRTRTRTSFDGMMAFPKSPDRTMAIGTSRVKHIRSDVPDSSLDQPDIGHPLLLSLRRLGSRAAGQSASQSTQSRADC